MVLVGSNSALNVKVLTKNREKLYDVTLFEMELEQHYHDSIREPNEVLLQNTSL